MINNILKKFSLNKKKVFVLGGCGLIGLPIVNAMLSASAEVYVIDNNKKKGLALEKKFKGSKLKFIYLNISNVANLETNFKTILIKYGCPNVLINCSYPSTKNWKTSSFQNNNFLNLRKNVDIHLNTYTWLAYISCEQMRKKNIKGSVILFSSIYGLVGQRMSVYKNTKINENMNYPVIKGGLIAYSKQLASYYGPYKIRVNTICPGGVRDKKKNLKRQK